LSGCQGSRNNSNGTPASPRTPYPPGHNGNNGNNGLNQNDPNNLNNLNKKGDDIVFSKDKATQVSYDPTNYTHVVNPNVVVVKTGYGRSELLDYTDAGDDNIMDALKIKLGTRRTSVDEKSKFDEKMKKDLDINNWTADDDKVRHNSAVQGGNEKLARGISKASLVKSQHEQKYTLQVSVAEIGQLIYSLDVSDLVEQKKSIKNEKMEIDSSASEDSEALSAFLTCVSKSSRDKCSTAIVQLRKNNDESQAYIVLRNSPANLYLGEYTSKLMLRPQGDVIIDRWVQFFAQVMDYRYIVGSTEGMNNIAELKTFAVVDGRAGFQLDINRLGYSPFTVGGELEVTKRGAAVSVNTKLEKNSEEDGYDDIINETIKSAILVHNNGRGMLQISLQLHGFSDGLPGDNGSIIMNDKATKSLLRQNQPYNRGNQAFGSKSLRLQEESNRALRITIVPNRNFGVDESLL